MQQSQSRQLQKEILMLANVACDSLISLKGAFHNEGCIGDVDLVSFYSFENHCHLNTDYFGISH